MGTDGTYPSSFRPTEFVCVSSRIPVTEKPTHRKVRYVWGTRQNLRGRDLWNPTLTSQESNKKTASIPYSRPTCYFPDSRRPGALFTGN
jgi:hypothetical protein